MNLEKLIFNSSKKEFKFQVDFPIDKVLKDKNIFISNEDWVYLKGRFSSIEIISIISEVIFNFEIPYPHKVIEEHKVKEDFNNLMNYKIDEILERGTCFSKHLSIELPNYYLSNDLTGRISSDFFQRENRIKVSNGSSPSPYDKWHKVRYNSWIKAAIEKANRNGYLNGDILRKAVSEKYMASQFPPIIAKYFFDKFESKRDIVDFSSGWGDRLCGFCHQTQTVMLE